MKPVTDEVYSAYSRPERGRIAALRRRADWLKLRIESSPDDLTHDKSEYAALTWVLGVLANAREAANGEFDNQELG